MVRAVDEDAANAGGSHLSEGDLLAAKGRHALLKRSNGGQAIDSAHEFTSSEAVLIVACRKPTRTDIPSIQKTKIVSCSHQQMINRHDSEPLSQLRETLHIWRHFGRERCHCSIASIKTTAASVGGE